MDVAHYEEFDLLEMGACVQCGTPLLDIGGTLAFISGMPGMFCSGVCIGQHRQRQSIAFR